MTYTILRDGRDIPSGEMQTDVDVSIVKMVDPEDFSSTITWMRQVYGPSCLGGCFANGARDEADSR